MNRPLNALRNNVSGAIERGEAEAVIEVRPLNVIAREIRREWPKVSPYAAPYLDAMGALNSIKDDYYCDSGESVVLYFLANANSWRGEAARRIKAELKAMAGLK